MSTAEILSMVSKIAYVVSGVSLVLALFFWFKFNIPSVISDLSGRTARKSIARIREHNEKQNKKREPVTPKNRELKPQKASVEAAPVQPVQRAAAEPRPETGLLGANKAQAPMADETVMLEQNEATGLLDEEATCLLVDNEASSLPQANGKKMTMLDEVILIHTDEVIP